MGTIAQKLTYLDGTKQALKTSINNIGGDITNETTFREYAQELDNIYDNLPKTIGEDTNLSLTTLKGKMNTTLKGDTYQYSTQGYNLFNMNATPFYNASGTAIPSVSGDTITIKQTGSGQWISCIYNLGDISNHLGEKISIDIPKVTISASNKLYVAIGIAKQDGSDRQYLVQATTPTNNAVNLSAVIPSETSRTYLVLSLGANSDGTGSANAYVSYEKPCVYLGNTTKPYEKYSGGTASPNPTYPQNIEVVTGTQEVKVENKNLWYSSEYNGTTRDLNVKFNNNKVVLNGTSSGGVDIRVVDVGNNWNTYSQAILNRLNAENTTYCGSNNSNLDVYFYMTNGTYAKTTTTTTDSIKINSIFVRVPTNTSFTNKDIEFQLEKGSTATTYVEHQEQTQQVSLGDIELCKIGNYQDYLYKSNDKWYKKEQIGKFIINGSENYNFEVDTNSYNYPRYTIYKIDTDYSGQTNSITSFSNLASYCVNPGGYTNYNESFIVRYIDGQKTRVDLMSSSLGETTANGFKTWLGTHNLEVRYIKANANDIEITNTNLISQLDNLQKLKSYNGTTNINSSGNLSAILGVSALKGE